MLEAYEKVLSIDIGGTSVKAAVVDRDGMIQQAFKKTPTPSPSTPGAIIATIQELVKDFTYDKIAVGFPGYIKNGIVVTAPNLGTESWQQTDLAKKLHEALSKPARVINDADMQGLGLINGKGFEMVVTLGTGFGTSFFKNGTLLPHLEVAHHPVRKGKTYDEYIGAKALEKIGKERWNNRVKYILGILKTVFNYDTLYIGGGNAKKINFTLDENIKIVTNIDGIDGGARLWQQQESV
ncbi:MAG TPA: ROK family protein [Chitinophagaceae bacterium]